MTIKNIKFSNLKKFFFEFLSIFFAVIFAFILDRWNEDRKDKIVEKKILLEIFNGLERDSIDLASDEKFIENFNIKSIKYFTQIINNKTVDNDSLNVYYHFLTRDMITIQNTSGYQTLKSRGLEIIKNDSLRKSIIDLYEVTYELHRKFSEEYDENKYMLNYFEKMNDVLSSKFNFDLKGNLIGVIQPINLNEKEKKLISSYLWKLYINRNDRLSTIKNIQKKIGKLREHIKSNIY
jgi:hypothetical protein